MSYLEPKEMQQRGKVYVNPNFNRNLNTQSPNVMHINPRFSQQNFPAKQKIFVNPHFVKNPLLNVGNVQQLSNFNKNPVISLESNVASTSKPIVPDNIVKSRYSFVRNVNKIGNTKPKIGPIHDLVTKSNAPSCSSIVKSRYSFVREVNENKPQILQLPIQKSNTVKINKYKSIALTSVKKKLDTSKNKQISSYKTSVLQTPITKIKSLSSRYKFIRTNKKINNSATKLKLPATNYKKHISKSNLPLKIKSSFKKNNIPCPLFKKYGKCLRNLKGKCDFLHDRKHVSICRKFLKGICHDNNCPLSHELSVKKMPTCYFYLKGMCTKDKCPYLHVKLNEKAKVCHDFLKGYCEKGDMCLNRHVNICPDFANKGVCNRIRCPYPHKNSKAKKVVNRSTIKRKSRGKLVSENKIKCNSTYSKVDEGNRIENIFIEQNEKSSNVNEIEQRYYKESKEANTSEVQTIMPNRCKLGTLPSFIQL